MTPTTRNRTTRRFRRRRFHVRARRRSCAPTSPPITGHRFYNPEIGRWLNRDPIGELGGLNYYGAFWNDSIGYIDILGREPEPSNSQAASDPSNATPFYLCKRTIIAEDNYDRCYNDCGGQHAYMKYTQVDPYLGEYPIGIGFSGGNELKEEEAFGGECTPCTKRANVTLGYGSGVGKSPADATPEEIWDCIKNVPPGQYSFLLNNCFSWAGNAIAACGINCGLIGSGGDEEDLYYY